MSNMNNLARTHSTDRKPRASGSLVVRSQPKRVVDLSEALNEAVEDELLGAIADERAVGPFVKVALDDL